MEFCFYRFYSFSRLVQQIVIIRKQDGGGSGSSSTFITNTNTDSSVFITCWTIRTPATFSRGCRWIHFYLPINYISYIFSFWMLLQVEWVKWVSLDPAGWTVFSAVLGLSSGTWAAKPIKVRVRWLQHFVKLREEKPTDVQYSNSFQICMCAL